MNGVKGLHLIPYLQETSSTTKRVKIGQLHHPETSESAADIQQS